VLSRSFHPFSITPSARSDGKTWKITLPFHALLTEHVVLGHSQLRTTTESARNSLTAAHEREVNQLCAAHMETLERERSAAAAVKADLDAKLQEGREALNALNAESMQTIRGTPKCACMIARFCVAFRCGVNYWMPGRFLYDHPA
jgi:hypothetical protein